MRSTLVVTLAALAWALPCATALAVPSHQPGLLPSGLLLDPTGADGPAPPSQSVLLPGVDGARDPALAHVDLELQASLRLKSGPAGHAASPSPPATIAPPGNASAATASVRSLPAAPQMAGGEAAGPAAGLLAATMVGALLWRLRRILRRPDARLLGLLAPAGLGGLFSRIRRNHVLDNAVRARVHGAVVRNPGSTLQQVREETGVARATATHHLRRLEQHGLLVAVRHGARRRYFAAASGPAATGVSATRGGKDGPDPPALTALAGRAGLPPRSGVAWTGADAAGGGSWAGPTSGATAPPRLRAAAAVAHPTALRVARLVHDRPGLDQKAICGDLGLRNPAASKHLTRFDRLGLVVTERRGRQRIYHPTDAMRHVLQLLSPAVVLGEPTRAIAGGLSAPGPEPPTASGPGLAGAPAPQALQAGAAERAATGQVPATSPG